MSEVAEDIVRRWMADIQAKIDGYVDKFERIQGQRISCRTCAMPGCCKQRVAMPLFEALPIVARLRSEGRDTPALRHHLKEQADLQDSTTQSEYFNLGVDCVFLEGNRCSIYEDRPTACRAYATFEDPERCQPPGGKSLVLGMVPYVAHETLEMSFKMHAGLGLEESPERVYSDYLPRVVLRLLKSAGRRNKDDWARFVSRQSWPTAEQFGDRFDDD